MRDARRKFTEDTIAKCGSVPKALLVDYAGPGGLSALAGDPDPLVRAAVARSWYDKPIDILRALLTDPDPRVRKAALWGHPSVPEDMHEALLRDPRGVPRGARGLRRTARTRRHRTERPVPSATEARSAPELPGGCLVRRGCRGAARGRGSLRGRGGRFGRGPTATRPRHDDLSKQGQLWT